ncbi:MAG: tyrosine--tRNA ligase [Desulfobacteraceae bacterium]|nr:tyrosine--tRNA ligase [Pseudomonadota bacterium]MBU4462327.1 tyrosine--tRNA ligase [Pseudomonadota bacterium]MCG2754743.1 tyrosine--tRNA ligase [Desulfobacteraceae bacterium]NQT09683.1 tyrosine--tRNA ligase [Desulfobacteraceae bacterium]
MNNLIDVLYERGFIEKTTHDDELVECFDQGNVVGYIGFDPTASSLHIGSLVPIMSLAHMQKQGHRPIALIGCGTGLVGDPSGKTETRELLTPEMVEHNARGIEKQLSRFIDFSKGKALILNNADWLTELKYITFLRDIGRHFSVNRMIKAESYKMRLESEEGLNFIEFNYMLLQAYDFLKLFDNYGCRLQMGGSDQWGNIVSGIELVRKMRRETVFGITFPLITTSSGAKMGKTAKGAVWLDSERTSPYEYYQYWINVDDNDVARFFALYTFLPMDEIRDVEKLEDDDLNNAKTVLAFETTQLVHGRQEAIKAYHAAASMFGVRIVPERIMPTSTIPRDEADFDDISVPHSFFDLKQIQAGIPAFKLFHFAGLVPSGNAAIRLIKQGGAYINGNRINSTEYMISENDLNNKEILLRAGKKRFHKIKIRC